MFDNGMTEAITTWLPRIVIGGFVVFFGLRMLRARAKRTGAQDWVSTRGTVVASDVQIRHTGNNAQRIPVVVYVYDVGGQILQGSRVRVGDEFGRWRTAGTDSSADNTVARYPVGSSVVVWFDPANPADCALER